MDKDNYTNYNTLLMGMVGGIKYDLCHMYLGYKQYHSFERREAIISFILTYENYFNSDSPHILVEWFYELCPKVNQKLEQLAMSFLCSYILWKLGIKDKPSNIAITIAKRTIEYCGHTDFLDGLMSLVGNSKVKLPPLDYGILNVL
jgi:hypothetical protein